MSISTGPGAGSTGSRRGSRRWSVAALAAALAAAALALTGCVDLPTSGPVTTIAPTDSDAEPGPIDIDPLGPQHDATPDQIVSGFLDAMLQTPIRTTVAREFLTRAADRAWQPARTITYASHTVPRGGSTVTTSLSGADQIDARGAWDGAIDAGADDYQVSFTMVQEGGQWRISNPPDALIVPESWFQERFQQVSLYFFDPTGTVLVPDPVYVPTGRQLASSLISGLLAGPPADLGGSTLDLVPPGLRVAVSVPVSSDGVADVQLTGDGAADAMPPSDQADLMVAQLAATLSQDAEIQGLRVSIGGHPVQVDGQSQFPIEVGDRYAPYVAGSTTLLYGLSGGRLVGGSAQNLDPVPGSFGAGDYLLRAAVPDLPADRAAGVGESGTSLLVGSIRSGGGPVSTVLTGATNLLPPAWDFAGRLWDVDRRRKGAVVYHVEPDGTVQTLSVPGITGENVKAFLVSRDGSRMIAVVHRGPGEDQLVVSRILSDAQGHVVRAVDERVVTEEAAPSSLPIRAIAWRSPTSIVVLHPVGPSIYQVRTATVDGAPSGSDALTLTLTGTFTGLVGTPSPDTSVYAAGPGRLVDLSGPRAGSIDIDSDVTGLTYPG